MTSWVNVEAVLIRRLLPRVRARMAHHGLPVDGGTDLVDADGRVFVRLHVLGGTDDGLTDRARVDVDTVAPTRALALEAAEVVREELHALQGTAEPDGSDLLDTVRTVNRPTPIRYRNPNLYRFVAGYTVSNRLQ